MTRQPKENIRVTHFFKKKLTLKFKMAAVHGREGRERRSTAFQKKIDPQHTLSSSSLRGRRKSRAGADDQKPAEGHGDQLSQTIFPTPSMFVGVAGRNCRMYTKVVLHKQTSLRYRIQRWFRQRRGSAARSEQNLHQNRGTTPEPQRSHRDAARSSPSLIASEPVCADPGRPNHTRPPEPHLNPQNLPIMFPSARITWKIWN